MSLDVRQPGCGTNTSRMAYEKKHIAALILVFIESVLFSGTFFGWPSLVYVLKKDGIFSHLCSNTTTFSEGLNNNNTVLVSYTPIKHNTSSLIHIDTNVSAGTAGYLTTVSPGHVHPGRRREGCAEQDSMLSLSFTISLTCFGFLSFPVGWLLDRVGLRVIRSLARLVAYLTFKSRSRGH